MNAFELGPLLLSGERVAILVAVFVFVIGSGLLAARLSPRFNPWSTSIVVGGLLVARLAYVAAHWTYFEEDPLRALAIWQGGFAWLWFAPVVALATFALLRTSKERAWSAVPLALSALAGISAYQLGSKTEPVPAAEITLLRLDGAPLDLAAPADRPTVINLWASWCAPCRREMPALAAAAPDHPDVRFLFVNQGESEAHVRDYLAREGLALEYVLIDPQMTLSRHYGAAGLPVTFFLGKDGRLVRAHVGEIGTDRVATEIARIDSR